MQELLKLISMLRFLLDEPLNEMLENVNFFWLLKFIYKVSRISGCVYTNIKFKTCGKVVIKKSFLNTVLYLTSMGLTLLAFSYDAPIPIAALIRSRILDVSVNLIVRMTIWFLFILKASNAFKSRNIFEIISNLLKCDLKVFKEFLKCIKQHKIIYSLNFISVATAQM